MRRKMFFIVMLFATVASLATVGFGQRVISNDARRVIYAGNVAGLDVFELPMWQGQSSLDGFTLTSASAISFDTQDVWNEAGTRALTSRLKPSAGIWVVNGEANPVEGYLVGCTKNGRPFMNRVRIKKAIVVTPTPLPTPVATPQTTPTPIPTPTPRFCPSGKLYDEDSGTCVTPPEPVVCPTCPKIGVTANREGIWNTKQVAISGAVGAIGSGVGSTGGLKRRAIFAGIGGTLSALGTVLARIPEQNRSDESFTFTVTPQGRAPEVQTVSVGQDALFSGGLAIKWIGDHWEIQSDECFGYFSPHTATVFTPVILASRESKTIVSQPGTTARKSEPNRPIQAGTTGNDGATAAPGNGVPNTGTTRDTRPIRTSFVDEAGGGQNNSILQNGSTVQTNGIPLGPCERMLPVNGVMKRVTVCRQ